MTEKYLVTWDFSKKASGTFYRIIRDELGTSHPGGTYELIQHSVALCRDDFTASRLVALAEYYGAQVKYFAVQPTGLTTEMQQEARAFVDRILRQRLSRRGRQPSAKSRKRI
ncbi:hypothetical protein ANRL3_02504 [Anaerolineae bacterium]|nr:hypothetical protein ANRL3_02504 [Anaerolineae bacterium]